MRRNKLDRMQGILKFSWEQLQNTQTYWINSGEKVHLISVL